MFICQSCNKCTQKGELATKLVIEKRPKTYYNEDEYGDRITSHGWEIKKEIMVCGKCASKIEKEM